MSRLRGNHLMFFLVRLLAFSNLVCVSLNAQVSGGSISGTVMDTAQAVIPDVRVTLTNVATGVARVVVTDITGLYLVPDLVSGSYQMTATASGFMTQLRTDITIDLGASLVLNVVMEAGDPSRMVRVAVFASAADPAPSGVGVEYRIHSP